MKVSANAAIEQFTRAIFTDVIVALARTLREEDFTVAHVALMHLLDPAPLSSKDAAERIGAEPPAMTRLVDDLVRRGLVIRNEAAHDRRLRILSLSPAGRRFVARLGAARVQQILTSTERVPRQLREAVVAAMRAFVKGAENVSSRGVNAS